MSISRRIVAKGEVNGAIKDLLDVFVAEEVCDIVHDRSQEYYFGKEEEEITEVPVEPDLESVDSPNVDIFGQVLGKKAAFEIQCPNCKRTLAAVRFAPHLEKCMGMGRNSSRIASRRLAASAAGNNSSNSFSSALDTQRTSPGPSNGSTTTFNQANNGDIASEDDHFEDVDDDEDWTMEKKRRGKKAVEKATSRR